MDIGLLYGLADSPDFFQYFSPFFFFIMYIDNFVNSHKDRETGN